MGIIIQIILFTQLKHTYYPVGFSMFTEFVTLSWGSGHCVTQDGQSGVIWQSLSTLSTLARTNLLPVPMCLPALGVLYKQNHRMCVLLGLAAA